MTGRPACPRCNDRGFIAAPVPRGIQSETCGCQQNLPLNYTGAAGEAGQAYLDELCRGRDGSFHVGPVWLPGTFLWQELFERMQRAELAAQGGAS